MAATTQPKKQTIRAVPYSHQQRGGRDPPETIDDIASALLDDSSMEQQAHLGVKLPATTGTVSHPSKVKGAGLAPIEPNGLYQTRLVAPVTGPHGASDGTIDDRKNLVSEKKSPCPPIPRKASGRRRKGSVRTRRVSPRGSSGIGPTRSTTRSRAGSLDPLGMNPPKLAASTSMSLGGLRDQGEGGPIPSTTRSADPGDAAGSVLVISPTTQASKPEPRPMPCLPPSRTNSRVSRLMKQKSVFKKMTNALADRFYAKSQIFTKGRGAADGNPSVEIFTDQKEGNLQESAPDTAVASVTAHRSGNPDKGRVSMIDAGHSLRKSASNNGTYHRISELLEDPFKDPASKKRSPTEFENRLRQKSVSESDYSVVRPLSIGDPFETEKVFDSSINSILPSAPLAFSTPRTRTESSFSFAVSGSPTKKAKAAMPPDLLGANLATGSLESRSSDLNQDNFDGQVLRETSRNIAGRQRRRPAKLEFSYVPVVGADDRKKHPSPNKSDLEILEMRFRKQFPQIVHGTVDENDETDELAKSFLASKIRRLNNTLPLDDTDVEPLNAKAQPRLSGGQQGSSLVPRPRPQTRSWTQRGRRAVYSRPVADSTEIDELQWDMKTSGLDMNEAS